MAAHDTIVALSTGQLPSGVAIVRLSGPEVVQVARIMGLELSDKKNAPRRAHLRVLIDPEDGSALDEGLVIWFPAPNSFTGQDCLEFHVHGSRAVVSRLLDLCCAEENVRLATQGEFSRRAFENGQLDLTAVDALKDLIESETESQRRLALARKSGNLLQRVEIWRRELISLMVVLEANLDFSDEGDIDDFDPSVIDLRAQSLVNEWAALISGYGKAEIIKEGFRVVLLGAANSGKSSLLNALAGSEVAIVSSEAGTTRDLKDVQLNLDGHLIVVTDSAGLRASDSLAEQEGIRRAKRAVGEADLCFHLVSPDTVDILDEVELSDVPRWLISSKADLGAIKNTDYAISTVTGNGISMLIERLASHVSKQIGREDILVSQLRDKNALLTCAGLLGDKKVDPEYPEVFAEQLRQTVFELDRLIGRVDVEDMLDSLFSGFCIGK